MVTINSDGHRAWIIASLCAFRLALPVHHAGLRLGSPPRSPPGSRRGAPDCPPRRRDPRPARPHRATAWARRASEPGTSAGPIAPAPGTHQPGIYAAGPPLASPLLLDRGPARQQANLPRDQVGRRVTLCEQQNIIANPGFGYFGSVQPATHNRAESFVGVAHAHSAASALASSLSAGPASGV